MQYYSILCLLYYSIVCSIRCDGLRAEPWARSLCRLKMFSQRPTKAWGQEARERRPCLVADKWGQH